MSPRPSAAPTAGPSSASSTPAPAAVPDETAGPTDERYLLEEDLVDEISIDGMCGVY